MSRKFVVIFFAALSSYAQATEELCPFPQGMLLSKQAAREAVDLKNAGAPKADLLNKIPKGQAQWVYRLLAEMVDEVYDYPTLMSEVYGAYRFEHCFIASKYPDQISKVVFSVAHPHLKKCEAVPSGKNQALCAMNVLHVISGIPD